jgi:hypothetical protein
MHDNDKGKAPISADVHEWAGHQPDIDVPLEPDGEDVSNAVVELRDENSRGARLVAHMRGRGDGVLSTDEIMALTRGD